MKREKKSNVVLLIEDEPTDAKLITQILQEDTESALEILHAEMLSQGIEFLIQGGIDIVLLDLTLADSSGFDTFYKLQQQAPQVPVIILTGMDDKDLAVRIVQEGAQDYLVKSLVDYTMLARAIRYSIERKRLLLEKDRLISQLKEALQNIKTLSGLLPICAVCKQIRDDRGYWQQVESYVQQHSNAVFTHSICPKCSGKLYPKHADAGEKQ